MTQLRESDPGPRRERASASKVARTYVDHPLSACRSSMPALDGVAAQTEGPAHLLGPGGDGETPVYHGEAEVLRPLDRPNRLTILS